jgi:hypothetical protein
MRISASGSLKSERDLRGAEHPLRRRGHLEAAQVTMARLGPLSAAACERGQFPFEKLPEPLPGVGPFAVQDAVDSHGERVAAGCRGGGRWRHRPRR